MILWKFVILLQAKDGFLVRLELQTYTPENVFLSKETICHSLISQKNTAYKH